MGDESSGESGHRRALWVLRSKARRQGLQRRRVAGCGVDRLGSSVPLVRRPNGSGGVASGSVQTCTAKSECPVCAAKLLGEVADEITTGAKVWRRDVRGEVYLLSLTVSHRGWHRLDAMRDRITEAWTSFINGEPWQRFKDRTALAGYTRAMEATHSSRGNGWHPHFHVLLWTLEPLSERQLARELAWVRSRWREHVRARMGAQHVPDFSIGADLRLSHRTDYVSKLGLEVSGTLTKGSRGDRSHWAILASAADGSEPDARLWREWSSAMHGKKVCTWSHGFRRLLRELSAEELEQPPEESPRVAVLPGPVWDVVAKHRTAGELLELVNAAAGGLWPVVTWVDDHVSPEAALAVEEASIAAGVEEYPHDSSLAPFGEALQALPGLPRRPRGHALARRPEAPDNCDEEAIPSWAKAAYGQLPRGPGYEVERDRWTDGRIAEGPPVPATPPPLVFQDGPADPSPPPSPLTERERRSIESARRCLEQAADRCASRRRALRAAWPLHEAA